MTTNITSRLGRSVLYVLGSTDVQEIVQKRIQAGRATFNGNDPREGETYPAIIVRDWGVSLSQYEEQLAAGNIATRLIDGKHVPVPYAEALNAAVVNLQVFLDGHQIHWATSRAMARPDEDPRGKWSFNY